ncbi:MAG: DUF4135 domain-containing protein [Clostridiales bacterium]|nr:DUF4135 domain-containing protein [Clostridiales bacterium]
MIKITLDNKRLFFLDASIENVKPTQISEALSDPHNGGQTAVLFESEGIKYVYKPRSGEVDFAWADFLDAMATVLKTPMPRAVRPVSKRDADYTIVPFVEGAEAKNEEEARAFYVRWGSLLALCLMLGSTDMHSENVIADGDSPLLVDVETLVSGITPDKAGQTDTMYESLAFSHFLPNWMLSDGENVDVSALTGAGKNLLYMDGKVLAAHGYVSEIQSGFRAAYEAILSNRERVVREMERFRKAPFRKLLRPTDLYGRLTEQIARFENEEDRRESAKRLERAYVRGGEAWKKKMQRVLESETESVIAGDIPYFFCYGDERCLRDAKGVACEDYFSLSPVDAAIKRLKNMNNEDCTAQEKIIRLSLGCMRPEKEKISFASAMDAFELLHKNAVWTNPTIWMGLTTGARGEAYFQSIDFDLYDGLTGVMVFLGAVYEATANEKVKRTLDECLTRYRKHHLNRLGMVFAEDYNISFSSGLGGHILALSYLSRVMKDEAILSDAVKLFLKFDFDGFSGEQTPDVYDGAAGLLIALPCLKGYVAHDVLSGVCRRLAKCVCASRAALTGFGHGAAGMALALGAAQYVSGRDYSMGIVSLLKWENEYFDEAENNWQDLRDQNKRGFMKGLCSGAPGIGIARAQLMKYTDNKAIHEICQKDIDRVKAFLLSEAPVRRDTLCCGNASMMEAERILTGKISCAKFNDAVNLYHPLDTDDFPIGLMQGISGAGYALSRQMENAKNSFLSWEIT